MISVDIISKIVNKSTGKSATMVGGESNIDLSAFLLKEVWDSVWEIRQDTSGQKYIYGKLPVVTQYGVTMYADNGTLDIPSIYDGLPIDNSTLVWKEGVLMVNPDIELGGASTWDELEGKPSWIGASKPIYEYSEIKNTPDLSKYVSSDELKKYVTLDGNETITGLKDFTKGIKIDGLPITKLQDDVIYIDANLVVRGGVTMYAENEVDIPTLMDAIAVDATMYNEGGILGVVKASTTKAGAAMFDSNFFSVDANGLVTLTNAPSSVSTLGSLLNVDVSLDSTATVNRVLYQAAGSSTWTWKELTSSGVVGDYLPLSGGTLTGILSVQESLIILPNKYGFSGMNFNMDNNLCYHLSARGGEPDENFRLYYKDASDNYLSLIDITKTGRVGIGIENPSYQVDIHGTSYQVVRVLSSGYDEASIRYQNKNNQVWVAGVGAGVRGDLFGIWSETLAYSPIICYNDGSVLINTTTMISNSSIGFNRNVMVGGRFDTSYHGFQIHVDRAENALWFGREHTSWGLLMKLFSNGSLLTYGGITMYSDIRKKTKLQDVELSLSQVANAPLIQHYYNSDDSQTTHVGSIAQYWAGLNDWFCKKDAEGFYTMEIQNAALASAISIARHLERYESKTDKKIRQLKKRISQLEDKIEKLEGA